MKSGGDQLHEVGRRIERGCVAGPFNQYAIDDRTKLRDPRLKGLAANQFLALVLEVVDRKPFG